MFYIVRHGQREDQATYHQKMNTEKSFDPKLTPIGEFMAYKTGMELIKEIGRDKEILFISSPFVRCLQTAEHIHCGMKKDNIKIHKNIMYVEELVREHATTKYFTSETYKKLDYFVKGKINNFDTVFNQFEPFKGQEKFFDNWEESSKDLTVRVDAFVKLLAEFAKENPNVVPVVVTHGFSISACDQIYNKGNLEEPSDIITDYTGVVKFEIDKETGSTKMVYCNKLFY